MKKFHTIITLFLNIPFIGFAQFSTSNADGEYASSNFFQKYAESTFYQIVKDPEIATLFKFTDTPVSHATGSLDIQIPLYNLDLKYTNIPLSLNYNSSGIRIQDNPGIAGYGWSFNPKLKITRTVKGKDDLEFPVNLKSLEDFANLEALELDGYKELARLAPLEGCYSCRLRDTDKKDAQYDIYSILLPTIKADFVLHYENGIYTPKMLQEKPLNIYLQTINKNISGRKYTILCGIQITDDNGIQYFFGENFEQPIIDNYEYIESSHDGCQTAYSAWMLREILLPNGEEVSFSYTNSVDYPDFRPMVHTVTWYSGFHVVDPRASNETDFVLLTGLGEKQSIPINSDKPLNRDILTQIKRMNDGIDRFIDEEPKPIKSKLLSSIETTNSKLNIIYAEKQKIIDTTSSNSGSYSRRCISQINISSKINSQLENVKNINFQIEDGFLEKLNSSGEGIYEFRYDRRDKYFTPDQYMKAIDWWGYCNGKNNESSMPFDYKLNEYRERRQPDSAYTKIRALEKIIYPTGGVMKINYGTHIFPVNNMNKTLLYGAGLRINSIEISDQLSEKKIIKTYKYESPQYVTRNSTTNYIPVTPDDFKSLMDILLHAQKEVEFIYIAIDGKIYRRNAFLHAFDVWVRPTSYFTFPNNNKGNVPIQVWYKNVTEYSNEGKIEYTFDYRPYENKSGNYGYHYSYSLDNTYISNYPHLLSQKIYKKAGPQYSLEKSIENEYITNDSILLGFEILNFGRETSNVDGLTMSGTYDDLLMYDRKSVYPAVYLSFLNTGRFILNSTTTTEYFNNDSIKIKKEFIYDQERPYNLITETTKLNNSDTFTKNIYYSNNILPTNSEEVGAPGLPENCYKTTIVQQTTQKNGLILNSSLSHFKKVRTNLYRPYKQYIRNKDNIMEKRAECQMFDPSGNPVYIVTDNENKTIQLWSYRGKYMIAKIENADYSSVVRALPSALLPPLLSLKEEPSESDWTTINNLRFNPGMQNASITTYRYKPLVGITEMTDPRGVSTYYSYDAGGRLTEIYIMENGIKKTIQEISYKYYNE